MPEPRRIQVTLLEHAGSGIGARSANLGSRKSGPGSSFAKGVVDAARFFEGLRVSGPDVKGWQTEELPA
jgi:hypothetical protein